MVSDSTDLLRCRQLIEQKLNWGTSNRWTADDFEQLQQRILEETGVMLSASTLRRIWGRVDYRHLPSSTTLNTLARFAGFTDWRQFMQSSSPPPLFSPPVEAVLEIPAKVAINWKTSRLDFGRARTGCFGRVDWVEEKTTEAEYPAIPI